MNKITHKRSFLEVYTSEKEEEADVNSLQNKFDTDTNSTADSTADANSTADNSDSESVTDLANCETFGLKIGTCLDYVSTFIACYCSA